MFRKIIVFGLFEMIQKKRVRTVSPGPSLASGSGRVGYGGTGRHKASILGWAFPLGLGTYHCCFY